MTLVTKTINPLHFEDLEPHRFEDLVRQLIYDYKNWRALEATGKSGSDSGFDARGREIYSDDEIIIDDQEAENEIVPLMEKDRIWMIQCKREKTIPQKKLIGYLQGIKESNSNEMTKIHGLIFVACCDFSKKARDEYRAWCNESGISEFHIWGKGEIEDMLFQPKNDHLLFAYFGISLQIRKRSIKTQLRSTLSVKKQAFLNLDNLLNRLELEAVLLRSPEANEYPNITNKDYPNLWLVCGFIGHYHAGLEFLIRQHKAFIDDNNGKWDFYKKHCNSWTDPWENNKDDNHSLGEITPNCYFEIIGRIPYDAILAIDVHGDKNIIFSNQPHFENPHIYVDLHSKGNPFSGGIREELKGEINPNYENKTIIFPT